MFHISPGDMVITGPGEYHHCIVLEEAVHEHMCIWIRDPGRSALLDRLREHDRNLIRLSNENKTRLTSLCEYASEVFTRGHSSEAERLAILSGFIVLAEIGLNDLQKIMGAESLSWLPSGLNDALHYINDHYADITGIAEVCGAVHISKCTLERLFRKYLGTTPTNYLMNKRLNTARVYLLDRQYMDISIAEICDLCGFRDYSYFIASFRELFGISPYQFRKKYWSGN